MVRQIPEGTGSDPDGGSGRGMAGAGLGGLRAPATLATAEVAERHAFDGDAFVERFNEVWNGHQLEGILEMMTDDVVFEASFGSDPWGTRVDGKAAVRVFLEGMFRRIPDVRWDEIRHFAHPEQVTVEWLTSGTPAGGQPFCVQGCDILTIRDGLIAAKRSYRKSVI